MKAHTIRSTRSRFDDSPIQALADLTEINDLMAGVLSIKDVFRSVASRVCEFLQCRGATLWVMNEARSELNTEAVWGMDVDDASLSDPELPAKCLSSKTITVHDSDYGESSVCVPLFRAFEIIGVLQLCFPPACGSGSRPDNNELDRVGQLVSPIIVRSIINERNRLKALIDATTDLPNERAFFARLDEYIASALHGDETNPLSVISVDIRGFSKINATRGYSFGDDILRRLGRVIKGSLRGMDFIARSASDEFLVILPTADQKTSLDIISRVELAVDRSFSSGPDAPGSPLRLNVGWAALAEDGETSSTLVTMARLRKNANDHRPGRGKLLILRKRP